MAKVKMPTPDELTGMWQASGLKEKLLFTFAMIAVFRFGTQIPIFGINHEAITNLAGNNIINFLDLFSGGALGKVSIFALGIGPYITASIIMQLLAVVIPHLESLQKEEGEAGRRKISQYTRYFTVVLAAFQASIFMTYLANQPGMIATGANIPFVFIESVIALTAGSVFIMWLAELITERGIGNGGSLLIFISIISRIPIYMGQTFQLVANDPTSQFKLVVLLGIFLATIFLIVIMQEAVRKVIIVNAKRQVGNKVYGGVNTHIPFKLNPGGVMPLIFAVAILLFPSTILGAIAPNLPQGIMRNIVTFLTADLLNPAGIPYYLIYFLLIVALTFFYASIMPNMQPKEIANNLKKYGSSIPGIKPGKPTADVIDQILSRTTFIGAVGLGIIALIPGLASQVTAITTLQGLGATTLIIMVGVALDFINQIKTHLLVRQYEGFLKQ
ncbi:MAG: preprotein translocase subunit SecY [Candidatus Melainabacteria bacterium RIFOXYA12_FULL_32_12]|nr:MAG: preprotein translocase subunit SecY [Candidatus Melainabacteria bacterium RIFOXYA2_FULL_32_9]OGI24185.1 MAG: preprotein translocase subunit SecY [Candidatus Melainabacteria bacterium RIFOXYA12_FULL_32_12]